MGNRAALQSRKERDNKTMATRKLKKIVLDPVIFLKLFLQDAILNYTVNQGTPNDAIIQSMNLNRSTDKIEIIVSSETFDEALDSLNLPVLDLIVTTNETQS